MRKLIVFLTILTLVFFSMSTNIFAVEDYGNVGPTTEFGFDIYIQDEIVAEGSTPDGWETTITFTDPTGDRTITVPDSDQTIGTATAIEDDLIVNADLNIDEEPDDNDILTYDTTGANFSWQTPAELSLQIAISGTDTHVLFFDGANAPAGDAALTYNTGTDTLTSVIFAGDLTGNADTVKVVNTTSDTTCFILLGESDAGSTEPKTDATLTYNADTGLFFATIITGEIRLVSTDADPDTTGEIMHDSTVASMAGGALRWKDADSVRVLVDLETDAVEGDDDKVVAYDWTAKGFYMKVDSDTGTTDWDDIGNPSGADEIDFASHVIELNVEDFRIGDGDVNYVKFNGGAITFEGNASINVPDNSIVAADIDNVGAGNNLSWDDTDDEMDVDDVFILHAGDISTGVHDFGGADSFEIPNKNADPANTGELILDTTVTGMTNGNLAFFDGVAIRYVVSLAAADIWSDDNYVVAYSSGSSKFFMKEDTFSGNFVEHFMDVLPEVVEYCHTQMTGTSGQQDIGSALTNPDVPRNLVVTFGAGAGKSGDVVITGLLANGVEDTETFTWGEAATVIGAKAFATVTEIAIPDSMEGVTVDVGLDNLLGLVNSVDAQGDVYKQTLDGVDVPVVAGNVNTTNNTYDCGTITANSDYTFRYHN